MPYADAYNGYAAAKVQTGKGTPASGAGGRVLPITGGQMGRLTKQAIESQLIRRDGQQLRGRHGSQRTQGSYNGEMVVGGSDPIREAVMRANWSAADLSVSQTTMTSVTTGVKTIIAAAGSWITQGLRVGDVIQAAGLPDADNNGRNLRITALTAQVITVAETLTVNATADTTFSIKRVGRTLINPAAGGLIKRYFTIEENDSDITGSEVFSDCCWTRYGVAMQADGNVTEEYGWMGTGAMSVNSGAAVLTSPVDPVGVAPLAATEAVLRYGTTDLIDLSSFSATIDIPANAPPVTGPSRVAPDVFLGVMDVSVNMTVMRKDLLPITDFLAENQVSLHFLATAQGSEPKDFFSLFMGNMTLGDVAKSALSKDAGGRTVQLSIPSALVGIDARGGAFDPTMVKMQVSNAA